MRLALLLLALSSLALAACDVPVSPERAYEQCSERARLAAAPRGSIGLGVTSDGRTTGGLSVAVSNDFLQGRDPQTVYDSCFRRLTGAGPTRPLIL